MYFRLVGGPAPTYQLTLADGSVVEAVKQEDGKIACSVQLYHSLETLLAAFPGSSVSQLPKRVMDMTHEITTKDGEKYKIRREGGKFKFWGKTTKVILFDDFQSVFVHFGDLFFKKIESFEVPEFICTDSKGKYVATVRLVTEPSHEAGLTISNWQIFHEEGKIVNTFSYDQLHEAMAWVLSTTSI